MNQETIEAAAAASAVTISKSITYGGSTVAVVSSLAANQGFAMAGLIVAVIGLCVNWHYQRKRDKREERQQGQSQQQPARYERLVNEARRGRSGRAA